MNRKPDPSAPDTPALSLRRWSQRKLEAQRAGPTAKAEPAAASLTPAPAPPMASASPPAALPPIESLTPESDFTAFFGTRTPVDDTLKRAALKTLLRDPRFNVMDGLDTYIDDYTREDPIPESVLRRMAHAEQFLASEHREAPLPLEGENVDTPTSLATASMPPASTDAPALPASDPTPAAHDPVPADMLNAESTPKP